MTRKVHCEKKTKIYIPKTVNPQIISCTPTDSNIKSILDNETQSTKKN